MWLNFTSKQHLLRKTYKWFSMVSVWYTFHMILIWMYNKVSFIYLGRLWWVEIALDYQMEVEVSRSSYWFWWYALHKELQKILFLPPFFIPPALCFTGSLEIKLSVNMGCFLSTWFSANKTGTLNINVFILQLTSPPASCLTGSLAIE